MFDGAKVSIIFESPKICTKKYFLLPLRL
jgi:hypothetical protein